MRIKWFLAWIFIYPLFKALTGVQIEGRVPKKGPVILAPNHVSFLDPPLVGVTAFREIHFLAKPGLFTGSKFFAWLIDKYNAISLEGTGGVRKAIRLLRRGNAVVIFPEGTRSRKKEMLPFHQGVGYLAINFEVPVIPIYITNSNKRVVSLVLRFNELKIKFGKLIHPHGYKKTRKDFARFSERIREEVLKLK
ncbi:MAG: 1-acyl-sn-glycerol-3-phosphate acyltransferase [candidate division WOR-3 bacterium]|nr:MAG: 1-acyl-sn-glycerol-3-phosphate acyltransferase [candidate division WOR-3 bacterium]